MNVIIEKSVACGKVCAPPSKSMAHRLLICAKLAGPSGTVDGVDLSEDIKATLGCLDVLTSGKDELEFNCNESGSTLRFFIPLALLTGKKSVFRGTKKLLSRPLEVYENICKRQNIYYDHQEDSLTVFGFIKPGDYSIPGDISSQFISGLLFALPLLDGDSKITILPPVESRSYINLTLKALEDFGVNVSWSEENVLEVKGGQHYVPREIAVEGDYSNAAFLEVFNYLGGNVAVTGLKEDSLQGDRVYREMFEKIANGNPTLDISDCPDLGPILFTLAAAKNGATFTGTKRLKIKESDRGSVMARELAKFGADIEVFEDEIVVKRCELQKPTRLLDGNNDHRIVMSLAVLLSLFGGEIEGAEAVNKSFPDFFEKINELGIKTYCTEK